MRPILLLLISVCALAQPAFEVASIRPNPERPLGPPWKANIQVTPTSVTIRGASLKTCIRWAYQVMDFQVSGPGWMNTERFDIVAKSAEPAAAEEMHKMMQTLLAERFHLQVHHETKVSPAYTLSVAKGGLKVHEAASEGESDIQPQRSVMKVAVQRMGAAELVTILSTVLRAPVLDQTGLTGKYDATIDVSKYMPERNQGERTEAPIDPVAIITRGLQEEFGLRLESKKAPVDWLVVDHVEKVPIEN